MPGRRAWSPGLGLDKFEAQALGLPKLWSQLLGLGLGLACQGLRARACTSLLICLRYIQIHYIIATRLATVCMVTARFFLPYILHRRLLCRIDNTHMNFVSIHSVHRKYEVLHGLYKFSLPIQSCYRIWIQIQDCYNSSIRNTFRLQGTRLSNNPYFQIQYEYNINTGQVCKIVLPKRICFACKAIHSHICIRHFWWWSMEEGVSERLAGLTRFFLLPNLRLYPWQEYHASAHL